MLDAQASLQKEDVKGLNSPKALALFFQRLGYPGVKLLPTRGEFDGYSFYTLAHEVDPEFGGQFSVYLFELAGINAAVRKQLFQSMVRRGNDDFLLVLCDSHYETLDFVFPDRGNLARQMALPTNEPELTHAGPGARPAKAQQARLRFYSFKRLNLAWPDEKRARITLRFLNALAWRADRDMLINCQSLNAAFDLGESSEEFFNNRSLFSDHFLLSLQEDDAEPESLWQNATRALPGEQPTPLQQFEHAYTTLRDLYLDARQRLTGLPGERCRAELIVPVLRELGFVVEPGVRRQELTLLIPDRDGQPALRAGLCLAYAWDRYLDSYESDPDASAEAAENPGAAVVARLDESGADWAMLTNGRLWRLYSARAHSRATNYFEIDLAELLEIPRRQIEQALRGLRYFWAIFRAMAFVPRTDYLPSAGQPQSFLEYLTRQSEDRAVALGKDLKERVFNHIFRSFANGFVQETLKHSTPEEIAALSGEESAQVLKAYFDGTLTFLFRLLFLLYAEARNLLPAQDRGAYYAHSLTCLKHEVAEAAGSSRSDQADEENLVHAYSDDSYELYERLRVLFRAIDRGNPDMNVPVYNGGLFLSPDAQEVAREEAEEQRLDITPTPEVRAAHWLARHRIPDRFLALGLDQMARDINKKNHGRLEMIDYKSLGVRQLGSIYEGLLEFRLRLATVEMAVVRGKSKDSEEIIPHAEAVADGRAFVRRGGRRGDQPVAYAPGTAYIENDRRERKATGSYYTPDYIVQYIIEQTVGPIMDEREQRLIRSFTALEQAYVQVAQENINQRGGPRSHIAGYRERDPSMVFNSPAAEQMVEEFFDLKVLDPAMGSGHFLVQTVDYITDHMLKLLNRFPHNPVRHALKGIEEAIATSVEDQGIELDRARLTEVNLLKRQVLKRCIYGVDLNPMAVELARVSLWLDSFTLGAPLSFLDHHLKWGNSLLGARVDEVQERMATRHMQLDFFSGDFWTQAMASTAGLIRVSHLSDVTPEQVQQSKEEFARSSAQIEPVRNYLNVYMSRWYSNPFHINRKAQTVSDRTIELMRSPEFQQWLRDPASARLSQEQQEVFENARRDAREHRFFHWEFEFPDVFIDSTHAGLKENAGFDAVIGNPPYVRQEGLGRDKATLQDLYQVYDSIADLYTYFIERGHSLLHPAARFGMITANKFMRANYGAKLRAFLTTRHRLEQLVDFGELRVFGDAATDPAITISSRHAPAHAVTYTQVKSLNFKSLNNVVRDHAITLFDIAWKGGNWLLAEDKQQAILGKLAVNSIALKDYIDGKIQYGIKTGFNDAFFINHVTRDRLIAEDPKSAEIIKPLLVGDDIRRYSYDFREQYLIFTRRGINLTGYQAIEKHLSRYRAQLEPKPANWNEQEQGRWPGRKPGSYKWYEIQDNVAYFADFEKPKIIYPVIGKTNRFTLDTERHYSNDKTFFIPQDDTYLLSLLNSSLIWSFLKSTCSVFGDPDAGGRLELRSIYVETIPIRRIAFTTPSDERERLLAEAQSRYQRYLASDESHARERSELFEETLAFVRGLLAQEPEAADVVHDLLAFLAREMLRLNRKRRELQRDFVARFEDILGIGGRTYRDGRVGLEAWQGKDRIKNFSGDYQRHEAHLEPDELVALVRKNRAQWATPFSDERERLLRAEYARKLPAALDLKHALAATDRLIDRVVYALYGLTEEEIEVMEGQ